MKKLKILLLTLLCVIITVPITVNADTKNVDVNLDKDYVSCAFTITVAETGEYSGYVTDPNGGRYPLLVVNEDTLTCVVEKVKAGVWGVEITSEEEVPKFTVKINATTPNSSYNPDETIRVGKDIPGLDVHFVDGNIEATWDESDVNGVKVTVTKLDNNQILDSSTVKGQVYRCDIPEGTKKVYVTVVPAESANISGIERSFTLSIPKEPNIKVIYADSSFVHTPAENVSLSLGSGKYLCQGYCNDELVFESGELTGDAEIEIPLADDGVNAIEVKLKDENGDYWTYSNRLIKDSEPPRVTFNADYNGLNVSVDEMYIEGRVYDTTELFIGTEQVYPSTDGFFSHKCVLHDGENELTVKAYDAAGNLSQFDFKVNKGTVVASKSNFAPLVVCLVAFGAAAAIIFIPKKRKKKEPKEEKKSTPEPKKEAPKDEYRYEDIEVEVDEEYDDDSYDESFDLSSDVDRPKKTRKVKKTVKRRVRVEPKEEESFDLSEKVDKKLAEPSNLKGNIATVIAGLLVIGLIWFVVAKVIIIGYVPTESMEPYIYAGGYYIGYRPLIWGGKGVQRGDVIIFSKGNESMMKRVIAVEGETISFEDGSVYINGELFDESAYLSSDVYTACAMEFTVDPNSFFVMGDNRKNSSDSRYWTKDMGHYVAYDDIIGIVKWTFSPGH